MNDHWKPALAAIASLIAGIGGTVATQKGRVQSEAQDIYEKRVADRVRMEMTVTRMEEQVNDMALRLMKAEAELAVRRYQAANQ